MVLARKRIPIHIVSELNQAEATVYSQHNKELPSAFTLEIAIMKQMKYRVTLEEHGEVM